MTAPVLYVRLRKRIAIRSGGEPIYLGQVAQLLTEPELESQLARLMLAKPNPKDGNLHLIDMMHIAAKVREVIPGMQIEHFGEPHVLVEIVQGTRTPNFILIAMVWLLLFIGSGLAIMNFHADVSMLQVHQRIYELITGTRTEHPYFLQIPYSFGIGMGMVLFFNHLFKKKFNEEPSPLEVEMFMYQENMNRYVITEEYGKIHHKKDAEPRADDRV